MVEMYKYILNKVSFDQQLFQKELAKAVKRVNSEELTSLKSWCLVTFDKQHEQALNEIFDANNITRLN